MLPTGRRNDLKIPQFQWLPKYSHAVDNWVCLKPVLPNLIMVSRVDIFMGQISMFLPSLFSLESMGMPQKGGTTKTFAYINRNMKENPPTLNSKAPSSITKVFPFGKISQNKNYQSTILTIINQGTIHLVFCLRFKKTTI